MSEHEVRSPRRNGDRVWVRIVNMWPLIVALVSVIAMATTIKNKLDNHEQRISAIEPVIPAIQQNQAVFEAHFQDMISRLDRIERQTK